MTPADYGSDHPLAGIEFQRGLEQRAYELCDGKLPVQRYGDFREKVTGEHPAETDGVQRSGPEALEPQCKGAYEWADLTGILPAECNRAFVEGMDSFDRQIHGFASPGTILTGVESRTSSRCGSNGMKSYSLPSGLLSLWRGGRICRRNHFRRHGRYPRSRTDRFTVCSATALTYGRKCYMIHIFRDCILQIDFSGEALNITVIIWT